MSDTTAQPGLDSLSKSFEPAALEAHWGPEWERRGYGAAGFRGTGAPQAGNAVIENVGYINHSNDKQVLRPATQISVGQCEKAMRVLRLQ